MEVFKQVFLSVDSQVRVKLLVEDGYFCSSGEELAEVSGEGKPILAAERVALNFLQHLSGIATLTRDFVSQLHGTKVKIYDTRKTTPGLRKLEKYAVKVGGGFNHRFGLYDEILIKDNHIAVAGSLREAVSKITANGVTNFEVEVESLKELKEALSLGVKSILLDNFSLDDLKKSILLIPKDVVVEISGGVTKSKISMLSKLPINRISVGALTQAAPPLDISLKIISSEKHPQGR